MCVLRVVSCEFVFGCEIKECFRVAVAVVGLLSQSSFSLYS